MTDLISRYRTKPVEIEISEPLTTENRDRIKDWILAGGGNATAPPPGYEVALLVYTLEGHRDARFGDRIVRGTRGEHYPIKPEPFVDKYEPAT